MYSKLEKNKTMNTQVEETIFSEKKNEKEKTDQSIIDWDAQQRSTSCEAVWRARSLRPTASAVLDLLCRCTSSDHSLPVQPPTQRSINIQLTRQKKKKK
jgi:hypothetical protein